MKSNKRTASQALEDEGEQQRFSEVVQKRLKLEDDPAARKQRRVDKEKEIAKERGVIYVGHIPHGFYEDELRKYFSQFGEVTRVRVSRSRKTGGSRGFAFVEFQSDAVAAIAADTMNGYLMFDRLLKVHVVPKEKVHTDMFALRYPFPLNREITRTFINMERTETRDKRSKKLRVQRFKKQIQHLQNLGISYEGKMKVSDGSKVCPKQFKPSKKVEPVQHTLLLDSDDDEIQFKTPPNTVKKPKHPKQQSTPARGETKKTPVTVTPKAKTQKTPITVTPKAKTQKKTPLKQTPSAKKLKSPKGKRLSSL